MKEFVFVEFLFTGDEVIEEMAKLRSLSKDFEHLISDYEYEDDSDSLLPATEYIRVSGKINSETASFIKLQNPTLAEKMRISYISDELKDRYRK